jgi:hypothetical protein
MVGLICWIISFPINVVLMHQTVPNWAFGGVIILLAVGIGVRLGGFLYRKKTMSSNNAS